MKLDQTYGPSAQVDSHALSGAEEVTAYINVNIGDVQESAQFWEAGAGGDGCIVFIDGFDGKIKFQGGSGTGVGSGNSAVELTSDPVSPGNYRIEVSYSVSENRASLFIDGELVDTAGPGDGTTLDPIAGGNFLTVNDPEFSSNGVADNAAGLGNDTGKFLDKDPDNLYLSDLEIFLDETQLSALSTVNLKSGAFITTWKTTSSNESIFIPTNSGSEDYDFLVDWGDGTVESIQGNDPEPSHTYTETGFHTVKIFADPEFGQAFPEIRFADPFNTDPNSSKIQEINQWGSIEWNAMTFAFSGAVNLTYGATDTPDLSNVTSMSAAFSGCSSFNGAIGDWDMSNVQLLTSMFENATSFNDPSIDNWDVSNVTNMQDMFLGASSFNQSLNSWDTSSVTDMSGMFEDATAFNGDVTSWDTSSVTNLDDMFNGAFLFNQDISGWNVGNVTRMNSVFEAASSFNQDISPWDTSSVTQMLSTFTQASSFNQDISSWDVSNVQFMRNTFQSATSFNQPLDSWDVSTVEDMRNLFDGAESFNQDLNSWDTSNVTNATSMFREAFAFNGNISSWDVSNVQFMSGMFEDANSFNNDISGWNVGSAITMNDMFNGADLFNQDISGWDVSSLEEANRMFRDADAFNQDLRNWDVSSVTSLINTFNFSGLTDENAALTVAGWVDPDVNTGSNTATDLQTEVNLGMSGNDYNNFGSFEVDSSGTPTNGQEAIDALCADPPNWTTNLQNAPC
jgi:surface protein